MQYENSLPPVPRKQSALPRRNLGERRFSSIQTFCVQNRIGVRHRRTGQWKSSVTVFQTVIRPNLTVNSQLRLNFRVVRNPGANRIPANKATSFR
jgi:hypothetical protein